MVNNINQFTFVPTLNIHMNYNKIELEKSISTIENAFKLVKNEKNDAGYYLTLWGGLIFLYSLFLFAALALKITALSNMVNYAWVIFPLGGLLSFLHSRKTAKTENHKLLFERLYLYVWSGTGIGFIIISVFNQNADSTLILPIYILLFGLASFITGGISNFKPSLIGGAICIAFAAIAMLYPFLETQLLLAACGALFSALIPGLIMNRK